jgi:hypothetical protein
MTLLFTKAAPESGQSYVHVTRTSGEQRAWYLDHHWETHDIIHAAVEQVLQSDEGFLRLINAGWEFDHFVERVPGSPTGRPVPPGTVTVEALVGVVQQLLVNESLTYCRAYSEVIRYFLEFTLPVPDDLPNTFQRIVQLAQAYLDCWQGLGDGASMELTLAA